METFYEGNESDSAAGRLFYLEHKAKKIIRRWDEEDKFQYDKFL